MGHAPGRKLLIHCSSSADLEWSSARPGPVPARNEVHLWYASIGSLRTFREPYTLLLDPVERERAGRFRAERDRERFILGHGLLRRLLGHYLRRAPSDIRIARGVYGKPFVEKAALRFNLSDTKDALLIGFTVDHELGVDLETEQREVDHEAVSGHYFTRPEVVDIAAAGPHARSRFLELWTRKEAVLKACGVGIMDDLRSLRVDAPRNTVLIGHEAFMNMAAPEYHVVSMRPVAGHVASVALPHAPARLTWVDAAQWAP